MRKLKDREHKELREILDNLLEEDVNITIREVARRHSSLKDASAFSRNEARMQLISSALQRQNDARAIAQACVREPTRRSADELAKRSAEVSSLREQVQTLTAGHLGLIRAVQATGGMAALERFWRDYKNVADALHNLKAIPEESNVIHLSVEGAAQTRKATRD